MATKELFRNLLIFLHLDLSRNLHYDRLTKMIINRVLKKNSHCIDVGCHRGEIMDRMLRYAPHGPHYAFEPIPELAEALRKKYDQSVRVFDCALSDQSGTVDFQYVRNAPAYSGLRKRTYKIRHPNIEVIQVITRRLDECMPEHAAVDFIKIDVEGGEFGVFKGGLKLMQRCRPVVLFECGLGASDYYDLDPEALFNLICDQIGLRIFTLNHFVAGRQPLDKAAFLACYHSNSEYYFVAAP